MEDISEHDAEHEREGDDGEHRRICFFELRDTVSVNDLLEGHKDSIRVEVGWSGVFLLLLTHDLSDLWTINVPSLPYLIKSII